MDIDYSFVIPAHNEQAYLPATLASVHRAMSSIATHRGEIVVTDNDSSDRTSEVATDGGARVVFEEHRQIARARNVGGHFARGRYLIFLDADTCINAALLRSTLAALDGGEVCGGGTLMQFDRPGFRALEWGARGWNWVSRRLRWACGAYVFCHRQAFTETGGFDERYYASEEIWFSRALARWGRARGMRFVILDEPIVTSARKLEWFGLSGLLRMLFTILLPGAIRRRDACAFWYSRPQEKPTEPPER
jgi:glycosyltransferase involved in cell wall biosynthesis